MRPLCAACEGRELTVMRPLSLCVACLLLAGGCSRTTLERWPPPREAGRDDKLRISGDLRTLEPGSLVFPLRVLFVVDSSESMRVTDPMDPVTMTTGRERAVRETVDQLFAQGTEGVRVGILRFSAQAQSYTPEDLDGDGLADTYFIADPGRLSVAASQLSVTDRTTNYLNALNEAYFEIRTELERADLESLPLSKYVVIFLSDGLPDVDDTETRGDPFENILDAVAAMRDLADLFHVGEFAFHTGYLSSGEGPVVDQGAQELLQQMAKVGGGTYRSFPNGEEINFLDIDLTVIRRVFTLRQLTAINTSMLIDGRQAPLRYIDEVDENGFVDLDGDGTVSCGEPLIDTDGDGLADIMEIRAGSDPFLADTDDDGLSDRVEWDFRLSGQDPLDPDDSDCFVPDLCTDTDMDGACDCILDSDGDGICDCVADGSCLDAAGHDCLDADGDLLCDCPDRDGDGYCDWSDEDGDGLRDCEEIFFGTSQVGADSDADGIPDRVEVRFRTSPVKVDDQGDLDWDLTPNATEVLSGNDPLCDDGAMRSFVAYRYQIEELGLEGSTTRYAFDVDNITLVPTRENPDGERPGNGWNRILLFAGEVAFDDPETFATYRVACVEARYDAALDYKEPPSGRMFVEETDFVDVREFDPLVHCIRP